MVGSRNLVLAVLVVGAFGINTRSTATPAPTTPTANTKNGSYFGLSLSTFQQDAFYGIPFAQPPVGDLRLRYPVPLNQSWTSQRNATERGLSCPGTDGTSSQGFADGLIMGEDCLTLDVIRPAGVQAGDNLPIFLWIYGGGFKAGGSADPRYNASFIVRNSVEMNQPVMVVIPNYRTMSFGVMASSEILEAGVGNIALFDQRMAMQWVAENIQGFGGDPTRVTIGGESAGGSSVGYHLVGFEGQNDGLFSGAIMESASLIGAALLNASQLQVYQAYYDNITATVGCQTAADSLACLRTVSYEALYNASVDFTFKPILDGRFLTQRGSQSLALGQIARVPVLIGSNTDEGTAPFFTPRNILNTDTDIANFVQTLNQNLNLDNSTISTVMQLYPNDPTVGCPFESGPITFPSQGLQFKRGAAIGGDFYIHAGRRFYATWQAENTQMPIYTYRFNQRPWNNMEVDVTTVEPVASTHFTEIVYVWDNPDMNVNWIGPYPTYHQLQKFISRCWVSFVYNADPNHHGLENQPLWPLYDPSQPMNIVFQVGSSYVEPDVYRKEQLAFWTTVLPELLT